MAHRLEARLKGDNVQLVSKEEINQETASSRKCFLLVTVVQQGI